MHRAPRYIFVSWNSTTMMHHAPRYFFRIIKYNNLDASHASLHFRIMKFLFNSFAKGARKGKDYGPRTIIWDILNWHIVNSTKLSQQQQ